MITKGQKISKAIYGILDFYKKERKNEKIQPNSTMIPQVKSFYSFFRRIEETIICFRDFPTFKALSELEMPKVCFDADEMILCSFMT